MAWGYLWAPAATAGTACKVPAEFWDRPRSGRAIAELPSLRACLGDAAQRPDVKMTIHYGGGTDARSYAEELRAWLSALAIDSGRVELLNDLSTFDMTVELQATK